MANKKFSAFSSGADATSASRIVGYTNSTTNNNQWTPEELAAGLQEHLPESFIIACSDETTALTTGTKATFRMPYAFTVTAVRASLTTAGTGVNLVTVDIHESGTTILSTKITIDLTEKTSVTAAAQPVISDTSLADNAQISIDLDAISGGASETGLKVTLIGYPTP